jgi:RimJ/RimL family protein N-acetyltransferase
VLAGIRVRLEPTAPAHIPGLVAAATEDRSNYQWTPVPHGTDEITALIERAEHERESGRALTFTTIRAADGSIAGSTSFLDPQFWGRSGRTHGFDSIEIGATWLAASAQRTPINTEAKLLMLDHAFDVWNVHRVVLNTDERNERSRAAIARIGATFEGVLRSYRIGVEGTARNTATFAITAGDWPDVRARLAARVTPA